MTITTTRLRELKARASIRSGGVPTDEAREAEEAMAREVLGALPELLEALELREACERLDAAGTGRGPYRTREEAVEKWRQMRQSTPPAAT